MENEGIKGVVLKEGTMSVERVAGTFRSPWAARIVVLTDYGLYVFDQPIGKQRKASARGALLLMVPIETINGLMLKQEKRKHFLIIATFLKDHRFLQESDEAAQEWRRLLQQAIVARRKQATLRGGSRRESRAPSQRNSMEVRPLDAEEARAQFGKQMRDLDSMLNEEINSLLHLYLSKRTAVLDEMMGRELWRVQDVGKRKREEIETLLRERNTVPLII